MSLGYVVWGFLPRLLGLEWAYCSIANFYELIRLCWLNFFCIPFLSSMFKKVCFLSHLFTIDNSKWDFELAYPKQWLKGWEPQLVVPYQDQNLGNHNLWFPIKIKRLGTTTCGSQSKSICWEPQSVVPNKN